MHLHLRLLHRASLRSQPRDHRGILSRRPQVQVAGTFAGVQIAVQFDTRP